MQANQLYLSRQADWQQLTQLLDRSRGGLNKLTPDEVETLGRLYRAATSDLALAQRDFPTDRVTTYLNQLVARTHAVIYRSEPLAANRLKRYVTTTFPRTFRAALPFVAIAALFFILPALAAGLWTNANPEAARWMLPAQVQRLIPMIEQQQLWTEIPIAKRPYASAFIMKNNIQVSILAFGSGILAGVVTAWLMIFNGLLLGGLTGLTAHHDVGFELWTFVIGHGVVELSVIFIAGGSGLLLGWSLLQPGLLRRRDALMLAAQQAVRLIVGCVPLLIIAGLIEGFISPAEFIPWPIKWGVGLVSGAILYSYLFLAGRERKSPFQHLS